MNRGLGVALRPNQPNQLSIFFPLPSAFLFEFWWWLVGKVERGESTIWDFRGQLQFMTFVQY